MAVDKPIANKMMQAPPATKGFHFASDGIHLAEYIEAETIEAATAIYHKVKRLIRPPEKSTGAQTDEEAKKDVQ